MQQFSTLLLVIILSFRVFGQQETMPKACTNPPAGIQVGGAFSVSPEFACLDFTDNKAKIIVSNPLSPSGGQLSNLGYIFNFKDGDNLNFQTPSSTTISKPGNYWVMQGGNEKGQAYITCNSFEVIQTEQPDIKISSCGDKSVTITFLNTPKNQKHGKYRIIWGDGSQEIISKPSFPFSKTHSYSNPPSALPYIVGIYTRGGGNGFDVCQSTPYSFNSVVNNKPIINELEGLNSGESVKLTVSGGLDGQEYNIQKKIDKGNWTNTGKTIIRNSGISSATQTIEGLSKDSLYCFRLQLKDGCNNEILSDEVCTIKLNATFPFANETKLDWNAPSANINRYLISYSDYPTGENSNIISATSTSQTLDFLDCKKKYNFQITAFNGTSPAFSQIRIKSPQIIIDPSSIKGYPAPDNISIVSVDDSSRIRYNIFETSGYLYLRNKYIFYRSVNGSNFEKVAESSSNFYIDNDVNLNKNQYCYAFKYEDECGIQSALSLNKSCNIKLSLENTTLTWTPFSINSSTNEPKYFVNFFENNLLFATYQTSQLTWNAKKDFDLVNLRNPTTEIKLIVKGVLNYNLLINGEIVPFPFDTYSNTVTYNPILSTSKEADRFNIYPNPSEDFVQLSSTLQLKTVEIVDLQGKVIENQSIENGQVSVKHLPKGKYILRLYGNDKKLISSKAIIKM